MAGREVYRFGEFTLDAPERRFSRAGRDLSVAPKTFDLLLTLVRHGGRLATKRKLLDTVWPESFVEEGILAVHISALRKTLGNADGGQPYIETVWHQRRYSKAIEWANKTLALDARHPHAREHLAGAYLKKGDFDRYLAENIRHAEIHGLPATSFEPVRQAYAAEGLLGVRRLFLARAAHQPEAFPAMQLAVFYGEAGDRDLAFRYLERAIEAHDPSLVHLAVAPQWDSLRDDARFGRCLVRMGLGGIRPQLLYRDN